MVDELQDTWARDLVARLERGGLSDDVLDAVGRAAGRASDGPWRPSFGNGPNATVHADSQRVLVEVDWHAEPVDTGFVRVEGGNRESDAAFIAVARTAVPLLLDEIVRLRRLVETGAAWSERIARYLRRKKDPDDD